MKKLNIIRSTLLFTFSILLGCHQSPPSSGSHPIAKTYSGIVGGHLESDPRILSASVAIRIEGLRSCSGAYVGNFKVLTAAHCISVGRRSLQAYDVSFYREFKTEIGVKLTACKVIKQNKHPFYTSQSEDDLTWSHDIAVLTLDSNCDLSKVQQFKLPLAGDVRMDYLSGFGSHSYRISAGRPFQFKTLSFQNLRMLTDLSDYTQLAEQAELAKEFSSVTGYQNWIQKMTALADEKSKICFYTNGDKESPFRGDSGGPSYYLNSKAEAIVTGIFSSFYFGADRRNEAFCYINLGFYRNWLETELR